MPIPLSLGVPMPRDRPPLTAGLLYPRSPSFDGNDMVGARVVAVAELSGSSQGVIVALDVDSPPPRLTPVRFNLDCSAVQLRGALALSLPTPLAIFVDPPSADSATAIVDAGHSPGIDLAAPVDAVADFLAVLAHSHVGFVARAASGAEVLGILAATVAALCGDDVRSALRTPDPGKLLALNPDAVGAVREVLLGVEVDDPDEAIAYLGGIGLSVSYWDP